MLALNRSLLNREYTVTNVLKALALIICTCNLHVISLSKWSILTMKPSLRSVAYRQVSCAKWAKWTPGALSGGSFGVHVSRSEGGEEVTCDHFRWGAKSGWRYGLHRRFLHIFSGLVRAVPLAPPNFLEALLVWFFLNGARLDQTL
jgi:hypothetical protein